MKCFAKVDWGLFLGSAGCLLFIISNSRRNAANSSAQRMNRKTGMNTAQIWPAPEPTWVAIALHLALESGIHFDFLWLLYPFSFFFFFSCLRTILFLLFNITILSWTPLKDLFSSLEFQMPYKEWIWVRWSLSVLIELVFLWRYQTC